jgi:hypothetical protein
MEMEDGQSAGKFAGLLTIAKTAGVCPPALAPELLLTQQEKIAIIPHQITKLPSCVIETMPQSVQISIGVLLCLFVFGCHTPLTFKQIQAKNPFAKNAPKTPAKIVDTWSSYAQAAPDGKVMRGMAGHVYFYDNQNGSQAVKVDGDITVYVFDGNDADPAHTKPIKVYQFKADTLEKHYVYQKPFGHGYNFFLPMDEIGGEEKPLNIIVRFDNGLDEMFLMTQASNAMLAGRKPQQPTEPSIREFLDSRSLLAEANRSMTIQHGSAIQQAGYITEKGSAEPEKSSRVVAIPLNGSMTRRLTDAKEMPSWNE